MAFTIKFFRNFIRSRGYSICLLCEPLIVNNSGAGICFDDIHTWSRRYNSITSFEFLVDVLQRHQSIYAHYLVDRALEFGLSSKHRIFEVRLIKLLGLHFDVRIGGLFLQFSDIGTFLLGAKIKDITQHLHGPRPPLMRGKCCPIVRLLVRYLFTRRSYTHRLLGKYIRIRDIIIDRVLWIFNDFYRRLRVHSKRHRSFY